MTHWHEIKVYGRAVARALGKRPIIGIGLGIGVFTLAMYFFGTWLGARFVETILLAKIEKKLGTRPSLTRIIWSTRHLEVYGLRWGHAKSDLQDISIAKIQIPRPAFLDLFGSVDAIQITNHFMKGARVTGLHGRIRGNIFTVDTIDMKRGFINMKTAVIELTHGDNPNVTKAKQQAAASQTGTEETMSLSLTSIRHWLERFPLVALESLAIKKQTSEGLLELVRIDRTDLRYDGLGRRVRTRGEGESSAFSIVSSFGPHKGRVAWDLSTVFPPDVTTGLGAWLSRSLEGALQVRGIPLGALDIFLPDLPWYKPEQTPVDADLVIALTSSRKVRFRGNVDIRRLGLLSPRLAHGPVRDMDLRFEGAGVFEPDTRTLHLEPSEFKFKHIVTELEGELRWLRPHFRVNIRGRLRPMGCQAFVASIPPDTLEGYRGFVLAGSMQGHGSLMIDSQNASATAVKIDVDDRCVILNTPPDFNLERFSARFMHQATEKTDEVFVFETGPGTAHWTDLSQISPFLLHAVLAHEDAAFFKHHGFSVSSIEEAVRKNLQARRFVNGASTVTMQLVKNIFLTREKLLSRKIQEAVLTWMLEHSWDKLKILELYLNVIEYGPQVYGIRDAARYYFNISPDALTPAQSVFIATILPNPKLYGAQVRVGKLTPRWAEHMRKFLNHVGASQRYDAVAISHGLNEINAFTFGPSTLPISSEHHTRALQGSAAKQPHLDAGY